MAMAEQKGRKKKNSLAKTKSDDDGKTWREKYGQSREEKKKPAYIKRSE